MSSTETAEKSTEATKAKGSTREARIAHDESDSPIGAAVWLNAEELSALGVDIVESDWLVYRVDEEELYLDGVGGDAE